MSLYDNLPHRCDIVYDAIVEEAGGADVPDGRIQESNRACWAQPASKNTIIDFARRDHRVTHTIYFLGNPNVRPGHRIVLHTVPQCPWGGESFEVIAADETTAGLGLLWGIQTQMVQPR